MHLIYEDRREQREFDASIHGIELEQAAPGTGRGNAAWEQAKRLAAEQRARRG